MTVAKYMGAIAAVAKLRSVLDEALDERLEAMTTAGIAERRNGTFVRRAAGGRLSTVVDRYLAARAGAPRATEARANLLHDEPAAALARMAAIERAAASSASTS